MNTQPVHDPATGDLRGSAEVATTPGVISVGDLPNTDTPTDDMRGHEPSPTTDPKNDNTAILGAVAVAALIGGIGIFTYATGMWNSVPMKRAPHVETTENVSPALPVVAPQQAVVSAPIAPVPSVAVEQPNAPAPVAKQAAAPSHKPAVQALPERIAAPPTTAPPEAMPGAPITTAPLESAPILPAQAPIEPTPPVQTTPDQPAPVVPAPQTTPAQPPQ